MARLPSLAEKAPGDARSVGRTIGILANVYEADTGLRAGGHVHFIEVVKRWTDVDIVVFAPRIAQRQFANALPHARFVSMPALASGSPKALDFLYRSVFSLLLVRELRRCDALFATSHLLVDILPVVFARKPAAVIAHHLISSQLGASPRKSSIPVMGERLSLWAIRFGNVQSVLTSSHLVGDELLARGIRAPIVVSTNGVDHTPNGTPVDLRATHREGAVFIGRIHPLKNVTDAVRAWRTVVNRFPGERLTIIGSTADAAYLAELERLIRELALDQNVILAGSVDETEKALALARAKIFLFPSGEEGWGIAVAEAMRAGLPCVTYNLPIFAEIFPVGRLEAALHDVEALAQCVIRLFEDEPFRLRQATAAAGLAQTFSWARASEITANVFRDIFRTNELSAKECPSIADVHE